MHKLIHLDLKGAPLKVAYLEKVFTQIKSWGATGVLLEWEDTFPYDSALINIGSQCNAGGDGMYSFEEVQSIFTCAKKLNLEAIQLVQTIGHLEFVLKHPEFSELREVSFFPGALCPSKENSQILVRTIIDQVLRAQPDAAYIHIGADEVFRMAECALCVKKAASSEHASASIYLEHIQKLTHYIKQIRPSITILMWDDMLRSIPVETLKAYQLSGYVEPVIWNYSPSICFKIDKQLWDKYAQIFSKMWAGSAFKGANGASQVLSPASQYASNNMAWMEEISTYKSYINFGGIILTGWSRYDHYATLCELLPVAMPSLASCLRIVHRENVFMGDNLISDALPPEEWPGVELAKCIRDFVHVRTMCMEFINGDAVATWLNDWQVSKAYTNPAQVCVIASKAAHLEFELLPLEQGLTSGLESVTGKRSTEEWLSTFFVPICKKIAEIKSKAEIRARTDAGVKPSE